MLEKISEKSKKAFKEAAEKLGLSSALPDISMLRPDLGLYIIAKYMLVVIIEAGKNGELYDITNYDKRKYEVIHYAESSCAGGSSGGGFSYGDCDYGLDYSVVGARLSFNTWQEGKENAEAYSDLWEIVTLNVK